ncbi:MAG: ATP-binding protein [Saprospiraceae bacterium]|nr:ATP-binding protein [Saprospiraceae bacterium]
MTGPESSGKTTLSRQLADHYQTAWVPEYARTYLERLDRPYRRADLLEIAKEQWRRQEEFASRARELVICDTGLLVMKIWWEEKYGSCHPWIQQRLIDDRESLYLLCRPDLPWEADPMRENPHDRDRLYRKYLDAAAKMKLRVFELGGGGPDRLRNALEIIERER